MFRQIIAIIRGSRSALEATQARSVLWMCMDYGSSSVVSTRVQAWLHLPTWFHYTDIQYFFYLSFKRRDTNVKALEPSYRTSDFCPIWIKFWFGWQIPVKSRNIIHSNNLCRLQRVYVIRRNMTNLIVTLQCFVRSN
jgi:hypothetical protein